jgi:hypothetical protein
VSPFLAILPRHYTYAYAARLDEVTGDRDEVDHLTTTTPLTID